MSNFVVSISEFPVSSAVMNSSVFDCLSKMARESARDPSFPTDLEPCNSEALIVLEAFTEDPERYVAVFVDIQTGR
jgi:hypothetical protein